LTATHKDPLIEEYTSGVTRAHSEIDRWIRTVVDIRHWGLSHVRDDIIQEVHKRLFINLSEGRYQARSSLKTYVAQITKYTCIEFLRQKIRRRKVDLESVELRDTSPNPDERLRSSEWIREATEALGNLPENCRQLFHMIFTRQLSYQDVARELGIAEGTVKSRVWRCREGLSKLLKEKGIQT
jgi:RNA polymerase sigma-70 factor (ECF subfamily)